MSNDYLFDDYCYECVERNEDISYDKDGKLIENCYGCSHWHNEENIEKGGEPK